jgi:hypothetical protein
VGLPSDARSAGFLESLELATDGNRF